MTKPWAIVFDIETTGLDEGTGCILECAAQAVNVDLMLIVEPFHRVLGFPGLAIKLQMLGEPDDRVIPKHVIADEIVKMHRESGLTDACLQSNVMVWDLEDALGVWLTAMGVPDAGLPPDAYPLLAGSGVAAFDRRWLAEHLPEVNRRLDYRHVDVSIMREAVRVWAPHCAYEPKRAHRALDDTAVALDELRYYRGLLRVAATALTLGE